MDLVCIVISKLSIARLQYRSLLTCWLLIAPLPFFRELDLKGEHNCFLEVHRESRMLLLVRQGDAKVFKKYSQMKLQMKREALIKMNRQANEQNLDQKIDQNIGYDTARVN